MLAILGHGRHLRPGIALMQVIGRLGNYFNQELYGLPTNALGDLHSTGESSDRIRTG
jgi:prolipoprotein diacylglyceryltransferase